MSHKPVDKGRELTGLALLLLAILFAITYYTPASTGLLGRLLLDCGRGLLGVVAYAVPVLFLYMAVDYFISHSKNLTHSRFLHIAILFLLAAALAQAGSLSYRTFTTALQREAGQPLKASAAVRLLWSASQSTADYPSLNGAYPGGVLGGLLTLSLQRLAGHAGALVLLIGAAAAEIILLFNVSLTQAVNQTSVMLRSTGHKLTEAVKQGVETSRQARSARMYEIKAGDEQPPADALAAWPQPEIGSESAAPAAADFSAETAALPDPRPGQPDLPAEAKAQPAAPEQLAQEPPATAASAEKIELVSYKETRKLPHSERSAVDSRHSRFFDIGEDQAGMNVKPSDEEQAYLDQAAQTSLQQDQAAAETGAAFSQIPILSYDPESDSLPLDSPLHASPATQQAAEASADRFVVPDFLQPAPAATSTSQQAASLDDVLDEAMAEPWEADPEVAAVLGQPEARPDQPRSEAVRNPQQPAADPASANPAAAANRYGREIAATAVRAVTAEQAQKGEQLPEAPQRPYRLPPAKLLNPDEAANTAQDRGQITAMGKKLEDTLHSFGVEAKVINITTGPAITRFELTPGVGVKVSRITNLADDIALSLAAVGVRIEAPIPGKSAIGIEIPNKKTTAVLLRPLIESQSFRQAQSRLTVALGRDIPGAPILCDLSKMPHLLIAGATGSGKSVCINAILISLLYRCNPYEVKLLMIDPKVVELSVYNGIPHLLAPVVTDPKKAANTLNWAVVEMTRRYDLFAKKGVRDLSSYNQAMKAENGEKLPLIVLVIDELSDLMNTAPHEVEDAIARLTAMARAAGMHLIIATQRPSVDVITGVIKANIPSRIAFMVSSQVDSRTILDMSGAEKLLGKGDLLYAPQSAPKPIRGQGAFITEKEVERVVAFCKAQNTTGYDDDLAQEITTTQAAAAAGDNGSDNDQDDMFCDAVETILDTGYASVSILQRRLNVGYPRAGKLIDAMERAGYIGPFEGSKPRKLLLTRVQWEQIKVQKEGQ